MNVIKHLSHITNNVSFHSSGGKTERTPSRPQLKDLVDALHHKVANKWRMFGILLEIPDGKLEAIAKIHRGDLHSCLVEMLETWLEQVDPPATWAAIIDTVEFLGEEQLGKELREKYCGEHVKMLLLLNENKHTSKIAIL